MTHLKNASEFSISVITPPAVTLNVLKEAAFLGIRHVWLQPGAEKSEQVLAWIETEGPKTGMKVIHSGPCVLEQGDEGIRLAGAGKL